MDKALKRGLKDRIYEKRKATALELERVVADCLQNNDHDKIQLIIKQLRNEFAYDVHEPQARYGGLLGFATVTIALGYNEMPRYLNSIIHPVLACFGDSDPDVRYYACEALYNISKVALGEILNYFNEIFDVLCKLVADVAINVKNAADILDKLIKDIVRSKSNNYLSILNKNKQIKPSTILDSKTGASLQFYEPQSTKSFSIEKFIPLLKERIYTTNTYTRLLIVSWLIVFNKIPDLELVSYLPSFLDPLLSYLKQPLKDVRVVTENFLILLLHEIKRIHEIKLEVMKQNQERESKESVDSDEKDIENEYFYVPGQDTFIDYPKIVDILVTNLDSNEELIKLISLNWLINLLEISPESFIILIPKLLIVLLNIINENNPHLTDLSMQLNATLMQLVVTQKFKDQINYTLLISNLSYELSSSFKNSSFDNDLTKLNSIDWLIMLQQNDPVKFMEFSDNLFIILLKNLNCTNNKIINKILSLLSKISNQSDDKYFNNFMIDLLNLFEKDSKLLDSKSEFIIKKICKSLDPERIFSSLSKVLLNKYNNQKNNLSFISIIIQILNNILITAPELSCLRKKLIKNEDEQLFENLFKCWSLNIPSLLCLTLLTSNYRLSYKVINDIVKYEIDINMLVQLDLLIQLLESPIFAKLRLDLLNPSKNIYLFKCLYGLLMLLPQSNSFKILQNRLNAISSIMSLPFNDDTGDNNYNDDDLKLLKYFNECQETLHKKDEDEEYIDGDIFENETSYISNYNGNDKAIKENKSSSTYLNMFQNIQPLETSSINDKPINDVDDDSIKHNIQQYQQFDNQNDNDSSIIIEKDEN